MADSRKAPRDHLAREWHAHLATLAASAPGDEAQAARAAELFTAYLKSCRAQDVALSSLPPGRFLMPGDMAGSPALTFAPLELSADSEPPAGSLWAMMRRRYDAYREAIVRPFFREHFARLDRQIVLVDALAALNQGAQAVDDLSRALGAVDHGVRGYAFLFVALDVAEVERDVLRRTMADLSAGRIRAVQIEQMVEEFDERLRGSAIRRIGHERWLRNLAVAIGNAAKLGENAVSDECAAGMVRALEARLHDRVRDLRATLPVDEGAVAQEIVRAAQRSDIAEEVTRFRAHLAHWAALSDGPEPCGRKLDFLLQEMNREVNTIGSKADGVKVSELVINAKAELERMREQVQNVE